MVIFPIPHCEQKSSLYFIKEIIKSLRIVPSYEQGEYFSNYFKEYLDMQINSYAPYLGDILFLHKEQIISSLKLKLIAIEADNAGGAASLPRGLPEYKSKENGKSKFIQAKDGTPLLEMINIPSGHFLMGSSDDDPDAWADEKPQREVYLDAYWIARTPVTNRMWLKFIKESSYNPLPQDHRKGQRKGEYLEHWLEKEQLTAILDHPAVYVSHIAAMAFCNYYNLLLPSKEEWEKAARGIEGRIYPWGDIPSEGMRQLGNLNGSTTTPVGHYPKGVSPFGLYDCAGNVWEWTSSSLKQSEPSDHGSFVLKGGSFVNIPILGRCACNHDHPAYYSNHHVGFRPAQRITEK
jgi:formylglycine-generating enzyme required for sulfatase activity